MRRHTVGRYLCGTLPPIIFFCLLGSTVWAQPSVSDATRGSKIAKPNKPRPSLGSHGVMPKRKKSSKDSPGRRQGGGKTMALAKKALVKEMEQRMEEQSPAVGFLQNLWHNIVFVGFYPFVYLNEHHGPMASNAFGFVLMLLFFVVPRIFSSGRERELKLKERLVRAKNTRVRVRAAKDLDEYLAAVHQIQEDDLSYPLKGLRKLLRLPPADPASYSQAVKDVKKEVIRVNDEVFPPGPRSLDRAIQEVKRNLVQHLNVREADASQMTSTIIAKSCHARSSDDAELALQAIVADTGLVELKRFHKRPLKVVVSESIVEVRRSIVYELRPTAAAGAQAGADAVMFVKCKWSMQFRSNTDEGTVTVRRFYPGQKRDKKEKAKIEAKSMGTRMREVALVWVGHTTAAKEHIDTWIDMRVQWVLAGPRSIHAYLFPPPAPTWGPTGHSIHDAAAACSAATVKEEFMAVLQALGKVSLELSEASDALGGLAVGEAVSEAQMLRDLGKDVVHIDGLEFKPAEVGTAKTVKAVERHLRGVLDVPKEDARASTRCILHGCCRRRVEADAIQVVSALCQNMRGMVQVVPHSTVHYPLKMRTEGKSGMRQKALCAEARTLYRITDADPAENSDPVWGFLETCISVHVVIGEAPAVWAEKAAPSVEPMPARITIKLVDKAPLAVAPRSRADRPPLPPNGQDIRKRRGSVGETTLRPVRNKLEKLASLTIQRGGIATLPNTPRELPPMGEHPAKSSKPKTAKGDTKRSAGGSSASASVQSSHSTSTASSMTTSPMSIPEYNIPSSSATSSQSSPDVLPLVDHGTSNGTHQIRNGSKQDQDEVALGSSGVVSRPKNGHKNPAAGNSGSPDMNHAHAVTRGSENGGASRNGKAAGHTGQRAGQKLDLKERNDSGQPSDSLPPLPGKRPGALEPPTPGDRSSPMVTPRSGSQSKNSPSLAVNPKVAHALARRFLRKSGFTPPSTPGTGSMTISTNSPRSRSGSGPNSIPATPSPDSPMVEERL